MTDFDARVSFAKAQVLGALHAGRQTFTIPGNMFNRAAVDALISSGVARLEDHDGYTDMEIVLA